MRTYRQILGQVLNQAVADGILTSNPVDAVKTPTVRPRRQLFLNADELEMLADAAGHYGPLIWFLGWSGLRFGEAAALKVGNVDPGRRRIRVEESITDVGGRLVLGPPKTYETRTVIVPGFVIERIAPLLEDKDNGDLVFTAPQGGPVRLNNFRCRVFAPAASAIGKPDLVPHDLRDTAASLAISSGASIKAVPFQISILLTEVDGATTITWTEDLRPTGFLRAVTRVTGRLHHRQTRIGLRQLKQLMESGAL